MATARDDGRCPVCGSPLAAGLVWVIHRNERIGVPAAEILVFHARFKVTEIIATRGRRFTHTWLRLDAVMQQWPTFLRLHRNTVANPLHLDRLESRPFGNGSICRIAVMRDGSRWPVARRQSAAVVRALQGAGDMLLPGAPPRHHRLKRP